MWSMYITHIHIYINIYLLHIYIYIYHIYIYHIYMYVLHIYIYILHIYIYMHHMNISMCHSDFEPVSAKALLRPQCLSSPRASSRGARARPARESRRPPAVHVLQRWEGAKNINWLWVKNRYPTWNLRKWKRGLKPAVPWFNVDPNPTSFCFNVFFWFQPPVFSCKAVGHGFGHGTWRPASTSPAARHFLKLFAQVDAIAFVDPARSCRAKTTSMRPILFLENCNGCTVPFTHRFCWTNGSVHSSTFPPANWKRTKSILHKGRRLKTDVSRSAVFCSEHLAK